jgi:valyl-tRNA synthetase
MINFSNEFDKKYDSKIRETQILKFWEKIEIYKFDENTKKKIVSIDTPPPTLSGKMHIGHAFSYTQQDFLVRFFRMNNNEVFFPFGTDDNGLPTEKLVQKEEKIDLRKIDRTCAIKVVNSYLEKERPKFIEDWKNLGISCDFENLNYSTIDKNSQKISQESFLELYEKNLIYRKKGPIPWDRVFQTTIAQAELEDKEVKSKMNYIKAKISGSENTFIIYATTRPEMIFACHGFSIEEKGNYVKLKVGEEFWILGSETYEKVMKDIKFEEKILILESSKPKKNVKTIQREGGTAIIENVEGGKFLIQKYDEQIGFVGGGIEKNETRKEAIKREIIEETGYLNFEIKKLLKQNLTTYGFRKHKNINQKFTEDIFYVKLKNYEKQKSEEESGEFKLEWLEKNKVLKNINVDHHIQIFKEFMENKKYAEFEVVEKLKGNDLIGENVIIPLINRVIKITHDISIKADLGTGCAYFCSFGGVEDIEYCKRHNSKIYEILNKDGTLNENCGEFENLLASENGRWATIKKLKELGVLIKSESITHFVNVGERSGAVVEYLTSTQWFLKYLDKKEYFLEMSNKFNWTPKHFKSRIDNWIKNLNWDYGFSRQRHFGIPIPVWYCNKCSKINLPKKIDLPLDPTLTNPKEKCECGSSNFTAEKDVLDTWFTSASTPHLAINKVKNKETKKKLFPMTIRPQGHDIINFWLFYSMAKSNLLYNINPFENVNITGWVLASDGTKMSKSKGNTISPQEIVEKFSNDSLRFAAASTKLGVDMPFQEKEVQSGLRVVNKLYNANKFAKSLLEDNKEPNNLNKEKLNSIDNWVLNKLEKITKQAEESFKIYDYEKAKSNFTNFFMNDICDNYLEIVKTRLCQKKENYKSAQETLYKVLYNSLKGLSPFMPFITEEIYQIFYKNYEKNKSIHIENYPKTTTDFDENLDNLGNQFINILEEIRKYKSQNQMSIKDEVNLIKIQCCKELENFTKQNLEDLKDCGNFKNIEFIENETFSIQIEK